jgi:hypothetical protein
MRDPVTVAVALDGARIGAKVWTAGSRVPAKMRTPPRWVRFEQVEVGSFQEFVATLEGLAGQPDRFPLRGELVGPPTDAPQLRRATARKDEPATLRDAPRRWLLLDLDSDPASFPEPFLPPGEGYAREVWERVGLLVPELQGAECWYAFTAGAGVKPGVRMRFAVWLGEPVTTADVRGWSQALERRLGFRLFDPGLYSPVQPVYVAPPTCRGMADPIPQRSGVLAGNPCGPLPPQDMAPTRHVTRAKADRLPAGPEIPAGEAELLPEAAEEWLRRLAPGQFQQPIRAAVAVAMRAGCEPGAVVARILDAVAARGGPERVAEWRRELPPLVSWTASQEGARRERELAQAKPHPGCEVEAVPLGEAERRLREAVAAWVERAEGFERCANMSGETDQAPRTLVGVTVGVGKTAQAVEAVAQLHRRGMQQLAYLVPSHKLGDELAQRFRARGLSAQVWRGVGAEDADGVPMCSEPALRDAALEAGDLKAACARCPARESCRYQAQAREKPTVWVAAHNFLFQSPPAALAEARAVVIDEGFWQQALRGVDAPVTVKLAELREGDTAPLRGEEAQELQDLRQHLAGLLEGLQDGEKLTRDHLLGWELGASSCTRAHELEWRRQPKLAALLEGAPQTAEGLAAALGAARGFSRKVPKLWGMVREMCEAAEGDPLPGFVTRHGDGVRLAYRKPLHKTWAQMPMLLLDATAQRELVEAVLGPVEAVEVRAELPRSVEVVQVCDQAMPRHFFHRREREGGERLDTWRKRNREALADLLEVEGKAAKEAGGRAACILQKDPELLLREEATERLEGAGVELGHFGAVRGLDRWRDVRTLVVVGRTLPAPADVELVAGVLFGRVVEPVGERYPVELVRLEGRAGGFPEAVEVPCHPDRGAEAVRSAVCEGELVQAVGRARAVRRGGDAPLRLLVVGNLPIPGLPPDRLVRWSSLVPGRFDLVGARWGVIPLSPAALVKAGGWEKVEAARSALRRVDLMGSSPLREHPLKGLTPFSTRWAYRLPGQRGKASLALGQPDAAATREALEVLLGLQLAVLEVCEAEAQAAEEAAAAAQAAPQPVPTPARAKRPEDYLREAGASPYRLAQRLGVSEEKLRRTVARLRKTTTGPRASPAAREFMARHEGQLGFLALLELRSAEQVGDTIAAMALEALERRDQALAQVGHRATA